MSNATKAIIILAIACTLLIAVLVYGIFDRSGILQKNKRLVDLNSGINGELISIREGQERSSRELKQLRDRERARLDREREISEREKEIAEREKRLDSRERARIDSDRESIRIIGESENISRESLDIIRRAARYIREEIQAVMEK
jgi:hypothetical protein